jgi:hypothetical protein
MDLQAVNQGKTPMELRAVHFANLIFLPGAASSAAALPGADGTFEASPSGPVAAGATGTLTLTIRGRTLTLNDLLPTGIANTNMTAVLEFADSSNTSNFVTVQQFLTPIFD